MINENEGDLALFNNRTNGEIVSENGEPKMEQGLETTVYISLFSGPEGEFWGNELNINPNEHYGGEFEALAESLDVTVENVLEMQEAILNDLEWMKDEGIAVKINVTSSIENSENVFFEVTIEQPDDEAELIKFTNNWTGQFKNPSHIGIE